MGSIGQNSTFFQNSTNTNQQRHLYRDNMRGSRNFCQGEGGGGSRLLNLFYSLQRGPMVLLHIFQGGSIFFQGGGVKMLISIETHIHVHVTITCDFPGGVWTHIHLWIRKCTMWHFGTNRLRRACAASF